MPESQEAQVLDKDQLTDIASSAGAERRAAMKESREEKTKKIRAAVSGFFDRTKEKTNKALDVAFGAPEAVSAQKDAIAGVVTEKRDASVEAAKVKIDTAVEAAKAAGTEVAEDLNATAEAINEAAEEGVEAFNNAVKAGAEAWGGLLDSAGEAFGRFEAKMNEKKEAAADKAKAVAGVGIALGVAGGAKIEEQVSKIYAVPEAYNKARASVESAGQEINDWVAEWQLTLKDRKREKMEAKLAEFVDKTTIHVEKVHAAKTSSELRVAELQEKARIAREKKAEFGKLRAIINGATGEVES